MSTVSRLVKASAFVLGTALFAASSVPALGQAQPADGQQAQPGQPGQGRQGRQRGPGGPGGNNGGQDFRAQFENRMKEMLGASDQEWAVLKPKIDKIQTMQRANDTRRAGFGLLMGNGGQNAQAWRGRPSDVGADQRRPDQAATGGTNANPAGQTTSPAAAKAQELTAALQNKETDPATLKSKLGELRALRTQSNTEVKAAQDDLKQLCSVRQEAALVLLGVLE